MGPIHVAGLDLGIVEYTTVKSFRDQGLSNGLIGDTRLRGLIREMSEEINSLTGQWFVPVIGRAQVDGDGSPIVTLPNNIPILEVTELKLVDRGYENFISGGYTVDPGEYVVHEKSVELVRIVFKPSSAFSLGDSTKVTGSGRQVRGVGNEFPEIPGGVLLTGAFGWVEFWRYRGHGTASEGMSRRMVTQALLSAGGTSVVVDDTTGVRVGDVVNLGGNNSPRAIITNITSGPATIHFDGVESIETAVASGTTIYVYGRVPAMIRRACELMVYHHSKPAFSSLQTSYAPAASPELPVRGGDTSVFNTNPATSGGQGVIGKSTGIPRVDQMLSEFTSDPFVALI